MGGSESVDLAERQANIFLTDVVVRGRPVLGHYVKVGHNSNGDDLTLSPSQSNEATGLSCGRSTPFPIN